MERGVATLSPRWDREVGSDPSARSLGGRAPRARALAEAGVRLLTPRSWMESTSAVPPRPPGRFRTARWGGADAGLRAHPRPAPSPPRLDPLPPLPQLPGPGHCRAPPVEGKVGSRKPPGRKPRAPGAFP